MKIKRSFLSVCLSISLMFGCLCPSITAYAVGDSWTNAQKYAYFQNNFDDINTRLNGIIINQNRLEESFEDYVQEYRENYNIPSGTSASDWISNNLNMSYQNGSSGNSDLEVSQALRQCMRDWINAYLEANTGFYYGYSFNSAQYLSRFDSQEAYHAFISLLEDNADKPIFVWSNGSIPTITIFDDPFEYVYYSKDLSYYSASCYISWNQPSSYSATRYNWSSSAGEFVSSSTSINISQYHPALRANQDAPLQNSATNNLCYVNTKTVLLYKSYSSLQNASEGIQDYYVTDSYNSTISGSYNTTTSNVENTIGSNNVNNYINNYYVENGSYPTPSQINVYINQNIDSVGDNGGGSGDDNGGGSDNSNWDFSFLSTIGQFIASLIAGIGEVIGGILEALTSIISSLREGFPNVIGSLLEYFLPFLPEEIVTLISLSIVFAILVGIIKLLRG